jgi:hypothetical protein
MPDTVNRLFWSDGHLRCLLTLTEASSALSLQIWSDTSAVLTMRVRNAHEAARKADRLWKLFVGNFLTE